MKITRDAVWHTTKDYSIITLGLILYAVGFCGFILPHGVITGGLAGIAALIFFKTGIPVAYSFYTLNIILLSIAYRIVGRGFVLKTIYGASGLSLFMLIAQMFFKSHPVFLEHDILLSCIIGAVLCGVGTGLAFTHNGSTGGTDIIAKLIVTYFPSFSIGNYVMILDIIIIAANGFTGDNSANVVLYSLICMLVGGYVIDFLQDGVKSAKVYYIITTHGDEIAARINSELSRGATKIKAVGAYTNEEKTMLVCLVLRSEVAKLRRLVRTEDPAAFVYVVDAREVNGLGFEAEDRKKLL